MIAISGVWKEHPDRLLAGQVGFDHHLLKPCDPAELLRGQSHSRLHCAAAPRGA